MTSENPELVIEAKKFAREAHRSIVIHTRSGDTRPQLEHLQEVADLVWVSGGTDVEIAAAWLHDSVEDTSVTHEDIKNHFGPEIAEIVYGLTDLDEFKDLPTKERKAKQAERVKNESDSVKRIKIADQTSNVRFVTTDPKDTWSPEGNRNYVIGAKQIADQCKGISPLLDQLFNSEYERAAQYFKI